MTATTRSVARRRAAQVSSSTQTDETPLQSEEAHVQTDIHHSLFDQADQHFVELRARITALEQHNVSLVNQHEAQLASWRAEANAVTIRMQERLGALQAEAASFRDLFQAAEAQYKVLEGDLHHTRAQLRDARDELLYTKARSPPAPTSVNAALLDDHFIENGGPVESRNARESIVRVIRGDLQWVRDLSAKKVVLLIHPDKHPDRLAKHLADIAWKRLGQAGLL
jgi:hypothetical protein